MAPVPADCVWGQDNVDVNALTPGFSVYAGYWNGPFANMTALRTRFPHAYLISVALRLPGSRGSVAVDVEPGTMAAGMSESFADCLAWLRQGGFGAAKPLIYVMASWAQPLVDYLGVNGFPRGSYNLWTAHYAGQHLCGAGCGYLTTSVADATQYATGANDYNVFRGYVVRGGPPAPPPPGYLMLGSTGPLVTALQALLNTWAKAAGFGLLVVDGDFGGKVYAAVMAFQKYAHLATDGIVGPATAAALAKKPPVVTKPAPPPAAPVLPSGNPNLVYGMVGKPVAAMQYYLAHSGLRGVRGINADGDFGPQTLTAVRNFQAHCGLPQDGIYGPATARQLVKYAVH